MPSIHDRIREELLNKERALWTALTSADPAPAVFKLSNPEANFMFPQMEILTLQDEDTFKKALRPPFHRFDGYQFEQVRTIIVDLMAGVVTYKIRAVRGSRNTQLRGRQLGVRDRMASGRLLPTPKHCYNGLGVYNFGL
ncbi:hypothetical protein N7499_010290 [Penicillium canescens]|nr:hypothetical protein N7499_010290 [Penicillium canescens]